MDVAGEKGFCRNGVAAPPARPLPARRPETTAVIDPSADGLQQHGRKNKLYFGDNLKILRDYVPAASVDLIYLDPPFNSSATYNVLFKEKSGDPAERDAAQITAFEGLAVAPLYERRLVRKWKTTGGHRPPLQQEAEAVYQEIVESGPREAHPPRKRGRGHRICFQRADQRWSAPAPSQRLVQSRAANSWSRLWDMSGSCLH